MTDLWQPPHSIEAEQMVIGALLVENDAFDTVAELLVDTDFFNEQNRVIWSVIAELLKAGKRADPVTTFVRLQDCKLDGKIEGRAYLANLAISGATARSVGQYAKIVRERSMLRRLYVTSMTIGDLVTHPAGRSVDELMALAKEQLEELEQQHQPDVEVLPIGRYLPAFADKLEKRRGRRGLQGIATGLHDLDWMTNGLQDGDFIVIAGRPSMGKTAVVMQIGEHAAIAEGKSVAAFSLEMSRDQMIERAVANIGGVDGQHLRSGELDTVDWENFSAANAKLHDARLFVDDVSGLTLQKLRAKCKRIARKYGLDLVIIDYIGLMQGPGKDRYERITEISGGIKSLAKELQVPIVALAQLNRQGAQRTNNRPLMSDLRDSGALEQDADVIVLMHREDYYDENTKWKGIAEAILAKQRMGPTGTVRLFFEKEFSRFKSVPRNWEPPEDDAPAPTKQKRGVR